MAIPRRDSHPVSEPSWKSRPHSENILDAIAGRVATGNERARGWGYQQFLAHDDLQYNAEWKAQYLTDDTLHIYTCFESNTNFLFLVAMLKTKIFCDALHYTQKIDMKHTDLELEFNFFYYTER